MPYERLAIDFNLDLPEQKQAWEAVVRARRDNPTRKKNAIIADIIIAGAKKLEIKLNPKIEEKLNEEFGIKPKIKLDNGGETP